MTSLPPDLFSSPPRSLSVSSRSFSVSPVLFSPSPKPLYAPVQASFRRRRCAVPRRGQWPVAGCTLRAAARVSRLTDRHHLRQSFPPGFGDRFSASLSRQVSGPPLCQPFPSGFGDRFSASLFRQAVGHPLRSPFSSSLWASSLSISPPTFSGNFSCQVSGRLLCQSFLAGRWVVSPAAFPAKSPGRLSANLSRPPLWHLLRSYRVSCLRFSM